MLNWSEGLFGEKRIAIPYNFYYAFNDDGSRRSSMKISVSEDQARTTVSLKGDIYTEQGDELHQVFNTIVDKNPKEVVIDLADLKSITSSGIGKIVLLYKNLNRHGGKIRIVGANETIMQIFKIVKLDKLMDIERLNA
jgi:anti-sigma B factor antagonist